MVNMPTASLVTGHQHLAWCRWGGHLTANLRGLLAKTTAEVSLTIALSCMRFELKLNLNYASRHRCCRAQATWTMQQHVSPHAWLQFMQRPVMP